MCRTAASFDAGICRSFAEVADPRINLPSPNGEAAIGKSIASGMVQALGEIGVTTQPLPLAAILLGLLGNNLAESQTLYSPPDNPSEIKLNPRPGDPPGTLYPPDPAFGELKERRQILPLGPLLSNLPRQGTRYILAQITAPRAYENEQEVEEWRRRFDNAIDHALAADGWNPKGAYNTLPEMATLNAGYGGYSMRGPMEKLGRLFQDRIAKEIAPELLEPMPDRRPGRIRVGIASINLFHNSGGSWVPGWLRNLDKDEFETYVFKFGPPVDGYTYMMEDLADHFYLFSKSPLEGARFIRSLDLDYLIYPDLAARGLNYQFAIFRLARRQSLAWGCPWTSGLPQIDDYLTCDLMEPSDAQTEYSESLVRLPGSGMTYYPFPQGMGPRTRAQLGLPEGRLATYCQNLSKWLPRHDEMLAEVVRSTNNPLLVFRFGTPYAIQVFERRMNRLGVPLLWMDIQEPNVFNRIVESCDISLDAPDWSGGHTSFYTLQFRTPVLTMPGPFMRGRLSLAYLKIAEAPEMITSSPEEYVRVAQDAELLRHMRQQMNPGALFDDVSPVRALENHIRANLGV